MPGRTYGALATAPGVRSEEIPGAVHPESFTGDASSGMLALPVSNARAGPMEFTALVETVKELKEREAMLRGYL